MTKKSVRKNKRPRSRKNELCISGKLPVCCAGSSLASEENEDLRAWRGEVLDRLCI